MLGETIGHYKITEQLGAGGMGVVYKARDLRLERTVALKLIRPDSASPALRAAFLREAQLASALNHPGIVTVYDLLTWRPPEEVPAPKGSRPAAAGRPASLGSTVSGLRAAVGRPSPAPIIGDMECIVMEYVEGQPLSREIPAAGLPLERALRLALRMGEAIASAHAAGIVHRDLKPANVLVRSGDHTKILDFGLAKLVGGELRGDAPTRAEASIFDGRMVGTLGFMAPELARGEAVDARADVFAFGAMVYQMLTGAHAFTGANAAALLYAVQFGAPVALAERCPGAPPGLQGIVDRALAKTVDQRWPNLAPMLEALAAVAGGGLGSGTQYSAVSAVMPIPPAVASAKTAIAVQKFESLSPDADDAYLASGLAAEITSALTGVPGLRITSHHGQGEAGARYLVTGTVRRAGARVRVSAQLLDVQEDGHIRWAHNYDREMADIFALQEDISKAIVNALGGELIRAVTDFAHRAPTASLDAWGLVRKAYYVWNYEFSLEGVAQALDYLHQAIALDRDYAYAHALLGFYLITTVINRISQDRDPDTKEAVAAAELACRLAPEDAEVLEAASLVWVHTSQYEKAVTCLKRAVRLAPFDLVAWGYLAFAHACAGDAARVAEARQILDRLLADAPDHPSRAYWHQFAAIAALRQADYPAAADHARQAYEMQPGFVFHQIFYAEALCRMERLDEARAVLATIPAYNPHFTLAVFADVARNATRSDATVSQLCGRLRELNLMPA